MSEAPKSDFLIVDGHALIYRAFHAFPPLLDNEGNFVGALYGFLRILLSVLKQVQPAYWLVAFDHPAPTKRKLEFPFYKAKRKEMPEELKPQIPQIEEAVAKLGIPELKLAGIEADDLIGTVSKLATKNGKIDVLILTGDRDSFQLVDDHVHVLVPNLGFRRDKQNTSSMLEYNAALVEQKMGVSPLKIIDLKALAGDSSDNIPGVPGVGPKTALSLLAQFGDLDGVYAAVDRGDTQIKANLLTKLRQGRDSAYISKKLATIDREVALDFDLQACKVAGYNKDEMSALLIKYGFKSLIKFLPEDEFELGLQEALF